MDKERWWPTSSPGLASTVDRRPVCWCVEPFFSVSSASGPASLSTARRAACDVATFAEVVVVTTQVPVDKVEALILGFGLASPIGVQILDANGRA